MNTDPTIGEFDPASQHRVLVLLDEFARLGKASVIVPAISYVRSFGLNFLIVVQTRAQLRRLNGDDGAAELITNCDAQVVYPPGNLKDAKEISDRLGTHRRAARSKSRGLGWFSRANNSGSESQQSRSLMLPQHLGHAVDRRADRQARYPGGSRDEDSLLQDGGVRRPHRI